MGFAFDETMEGTFELASQPGVQHPLSFRITVQAPWLGSKCAMSGRIDAAPLASGAPFEGRMSLRPFLGRVIRYEIDFTGDDGKRYAFTGQKDIRWLSPLRSWTVLPGELRDEHGSLIGTCQTRFNLARDWLPFASSFRAV